VKIRGCAATVKVRKLYLFEVPEQDFLVLPGFYGKDFFMFNSIDEIKTILLKNKGLMAVVSLVLSLLIPSIFRPQLTAAVGGSNVLEIASKQNQQMSVPVITIIPTPTIILPTLTPVPTSVVISATPTVTPTPTPVPTTATPTPTPVQSATDTPTPTLTPALNAPTPTDTPTPTPVGLNIQIGIDYAGQKASDSYTATVNQGQSAWDAVSTAVGLSNLQYTDYGGDMGIFITGFNGINADSSHYFEFKVNGVSSNVGISSYKCSDGDKLDFVLTSF